MRAVKCSRIKADGSPCLAPAMRGAPVCFFHATNEDFASAEKRQDAEMDLAAELKRELRRVKKAKGSPFERARLVIELSKMIREIEDGKAEPETAVKTAKKALL